MDNDDWRRMLRCAGGAQYKGTSAVDHLMLRYRPIAPKPVGTGATPSVSDSGSYVINRKRTKRKYVRASKNNTTRKTGSSSSDRVKGSTGEKTVVTLQLLPEKDESPPSASCNNNDYLDRAVETIIGEKQESYPTTWVRNSGHDSRDSVADLTVIETWVTVECVTGASALAGTPSHTFGSSCTDAEIMDRLDKDTYPGFISDGTNRVTWVNDAYKRMVTGRESPEILVHLVVKETVPFHLRRTFTCRLRLQYAWQKRRCSKTVPCDVSRMEFGGFAWRLDIDAALGLGL